MLKRMITISFGFIFLLMIVNQTMAATKEDVIATLNSTYQVGDESFRLPDRIRVKMVNFIEKKEDLTPSQCDQLIYFANRAYEIAQNAGTTDINQMDTEDLKEGFGLLVEVSNTVEIDLEKELAEANITLPNVNDTSKGEVKEETKEEEIIDTKEEMSSGESGEHINGEEIALSSKEDNKPVITQDIKVDEITPKINNIITISFALVFVVFLVSVLLLCLVLKSKLRKPLKWFLVVLFCLLIIISITASVLGVMYLKTIRLTLRLYYMFL